MSNQDYATHIRQNLFVAPYTPDFQLARTLSADRDPREPWYSDPSSACSAFIIPSCTTLPTPDGGLYHFESFLGYGGVVITPATYLDFMKRYEADGHPRVGQNWISLGSINGTTTYARWRSNGTLLVAFFNQRNDASGLPYNDVLVQMMEKATNGITKWP